MKKEEIIIEMAKEISEKTGYPEIVIFGYDPDDGSQHVTTFGKKKRHCLDAARLGNWLKRHLGWDEKFCNAQPSKEILDSKED